MNETKKCTACKNVLNSTYQPSIHTTFITSFEAMLYVMYVDVIWSKTGALAAE